MRKLSIVLTVLLSVLLAFVACDNSIDIGLDTKVDPYKTPLTLEFINAGDFWIHYDAYYDLSLVEYSLNGQAKGKLANDQHVKVSAGDIICLFRDVAGARSVPYPVNINCDSQCYVYGNVMSLIDSDDFATLDEVYATFRGLFSGNEHISNHPTIDIILPATTLAEGCYSGMFYGCKGLTRAPELPATQLAVGCYAYMFADCTSLESAPELPAKTMTVSCYEGMFYGCTSLTTAPVLSAKTLADYCYSKMFYDCERLNSITCLATNISASGCTTNWVYGVAADGTFTRHDSSVLWAEGVSGYPDNWTLEDYYK